NALLVDFLQLVVVSASIGIARGIKTLDAKGTALVECFFGSEIGRCHRRCFTIPGIFHRVNRTDRVYRYPETFLEICRPVDRAFGIDMRARKLNGDGALLKYDAAVTDHRVTAVQRDTQRSGAVDTQRVVPWTIGKLGHGTIGGVAYGDTGQAARRGKGEGIGEIVLAVVKPFMCLTIGEPV